MAIWNLFVYCAFHKHANSKVQKPPSQLRFSLPSIKITITINEPWNTETHKTDWNPPITNPKPWPFEPVKVKFCFLRGPLRWLTAAKNVVVSRLLNFRIRMFVKSAVTILVKFRWTLDWNWGLFHVTPPQLTYPTFSRLHFFSPSPMLYLQMSDKWIDIGEGLTWQVLQQMWRVLSVAIFPFIDDYFCAFGPNLSKGRLIRFTRFVLFQ